jgi:hypothetical protein
MVSARVCCGEHICLAIGRHLGRDRGATAPAYGPGDQWQLPRLPSIHEPTTCSVNSGWLSGSRGRASQYGNKLSSCGVTWTSFWNAIRGQRIPVARNEYGRSFDQKRSSGCRIAPPWFHQPEARRKRRQGVGRPNMFPVHRDRRPASAPGGIH